MAYTTINKSTDYFNTKLYTGTGSSLALTGVGHQPDMVWQKVRSTTSSHRITDAVRGVGQIVYPNDNAQQSAENAVTAFGTDGFTVGTGNGNAYNASGATYVGWSWKAGGGQGSSNTDGTINTTYTSVNTTAGISISQYTGTGSAATIGHGLGTVPQVMIVKNLSQSGHWIVYHHRIDDVASGGSNAPQDKYIRLNETGSRADFPMWNDTAPTSSVFSVGTDSAVNNSGNNHVAYCFSEKPGFSKFGSVKGNGSDDGPFIYTGFKPAFYMHKVYNGTTGQWLMFDNKRNETNVVNKFLKTDANEAEGTSGSANQVDFLSNGIKIRENNGDLNNSTSTNYLYMAFAEAPLVGTNNIPATAK